jgi:hypothetical protein
MKANELSSKYDGIAAFAHPVEPALSRRDRAMEMVYAKTLLYTPKNRREFLVLGSDSLRISRRARLAHFRKVQRRNKNTSSAHIWTLWGHDMSIPGANRTLYPPELQG